MVGVRMEVVEEVEVDQVVEKELREEGLGLGVVVLAVT